MKSHEIIAPWRPDKIAAGLRRVIDPTLPLIDLHRHLDGVVRLSTILDLGRRHDLPLPAWDEERLRPHVQVVEPEPDLMSFIGKFRWMVGVLADYDACRRVAYENVEDAAREGLAYVELRFSPGSWPSRTGSIRQGSSRRSRTGWPRACATSGCRSG